MCVCVCAYVCIYYSFIVTFLVIAFEICIQNRYKLNKKYRKLLTASKRDLENVELKAALSKAKVSNTHTHTYMYV